MTTILYLQLKLFEAMKIRNNPSNFTELISGVPQESVLGPLPLIFFTDDVAKIVESFGVLSHCYVDDQQIYFYCKPNEKYKKIVRNINNNKKIFNFI